MKSKVLGLSLVLAATAGAVSAQQTINFPNFCDTSSFTLNGTAAGLNPNSACVLFLTSGLGQSGSAFLTNTFSLASDASFSAFFSFKIPNPVGSSDVDGVGADGIVFAVQAVSNTAGGAGGGIGFSGISNSVGVELDTWNNGGGDANSGNHIGIDLNGDVNSVALTPIPGRFNDGNVWYVWVDYNGVTDLLEARVSSTPARPAAASVSTTVNLPAILGTTNAFVGFTSGTGAAGGDHQIVSWNMIGTFAPIGGTPTPTPLPGPSSPVPTLSFPMMALLALALGTVAIAFLMRRT
jgi:legume-like lectin family protein